MGYLLPNAAGVRGAAVADIGAVTSTTPTAIGSAAATGGDAPTEAEYNLLRTDVVNLRTTVAALVVDVAAARTKILALQDSLQGGGVIAP